MSLQDHLEILRLAERGDLPATIDDNCEVPVQIVRELYEAGFLHAIDATSFDGPAFLNARITMAGRQYLATASNEGASVKQEQTRTSLPSAVRLFISHTSADEVLVERLIDLVEKALRLPASAIRCTSLDGYRLRGGADTNETLRQEVVESEAFVGVITDRSLQSLYVAFELGARWGARKHLVPLFTPSVSLDKVKGPLGGRNGLRLDNPAQLHQFLRELGETLGVEPQSASVYQACLERVVAAASEPRASGPFTPEPGSARHGASPNLDPQLLAVLEFLCDREWVRPTDVATELGMHIQRAKLALEQLEEYGFVAPSFAAPDEYSLESTGRAYLADRGLLP